jgi:hypothetical protein
LGDAGRGARETVAREETERNLWIDARVIFMLIYVLDVRRFQFIQRRGLECFVYFILVVNVFHSLDLVRLSPLSRLPSLAPLHSLCIIPAFNTRTRRHRVILYVPSIPPILRSPHSSFTIIPITRPPLFIHRKFIQPRTPFDHPRRQPPPRREESLLLRISRRRSRARASR